MANSQQALLDSQTPLSGMCFSSMTYRGISFWIGVWKVFVTYYEITQDKLSQKKQSIPTDRLLCLAVMIIDLPKLSWRPNCPHSEAYSQISWRINGYPSFQEVKWLLVRTGLRVCADSAEHQNNWLNMQPVCFFLLFFEVSKGPKHCPSTFFNEQNFKATTLFLSWAHHSKHSVLICVAHDAGKESK